MSVASLVTAWELGIVLSLLKSGASAALLDNDERGQLHSLSNSDAEDTRVMASRLMAAGVTLKAWVWRLSDLSHGGAGRDSHYGHTNSAPLF